MGTLLKIKFHLILGADFDKVDFAPPDKIIPLTDLSIIFFFIKFLMIY